jgi:HAD superfamily hydrolase (TIGR01459 family)
MSFPHLISGLSQIAAHHDALICDVWGVIHDGHRHHADAAHALAEFREHHGPVVLLTNAPRVPADVAAQCAAYGLPTGCYDAIVSSGGAARDELVRRSAASTLSLYYIGPERDLGVLAGLDIKRTGIEDADVALCIGLVDDMTETPDDYAGILALMRARGLTMLCANPDIQVHRGSTLVWCAGALAQAYEILGGAAVYYGKPHLPVYDAALKAAAVAAKAANRQSPKRPLAVGDGLLTDIRGANAAGLDVLFVADGVHGEHVDPFTPQHLSGLFAQFGAHAGTAIRTLKW